MVNLDSNQQVHHYQFNECYMAMYNQAKRSPRRHCTLYLYSFDIKLVRQERCQHTDDLYYPLTTKWVSDNLGYHLFANVAIYGTLQFFF